MFIVAFSHKYLRHTCYFGPFISTEEAVTWADEKQDEYWTFYHVEQLFQP